MAWDPFEPISGNPDLPRKKKPAVAENQYTPDTGPLPNLDPGKMSAPETDTPNVDRMASYYPPMTPAQQTQQSQADKEDFDFAQRGQELQRRAGGQASSSELASEGNEAADARYQMQAQAQRSLAAHGFAASSALGLQYEKDVDRQVSELMERRRGERERSAMNDLNTYYSQQQSRRQGQQAQANQQQQFGMQQQQQDQGQQNYMANMAEEQRRYEEEQAQAADAKKQQQEWWRPSNWLNTISSLGQSAKNIGEGYKAVSTLQNPGTAGTPRARPRS